MKKLVGLKKIMLSRIKALLFVIEFVITVLFVIILMLIFRKQHKTIRKIWGKIQRFFIGYKLNVYGTINKDAKLLIINHQSMLDIIILEDFCHENIAWCAKKELFKVPIFGQALKLSSMISVDRSDRRALVKLIHDAKDRLSDGRVIAIFPEGTRGDGKNLLNFQLGAKVLAEKLNLTVQPIVINNARDIFNMNSFKINSGTVDISFMPTIDVKQNSNWYDKVYFSMQEELKKLQIKS